MEKSVNQVEKNVSASFGYVKKDMLMLNDAFSDLHDKVQHLSLNHATLLEEITKLRRELAKFSGKKVAKVAKKKAVKKVVKKKTAKKVTKKVVKKAVAKKTVAKKVTKKEDLTRIEGIGPGIKKLLWKKDIDTYRKLGNRTPEDLREILDKAGPKFQMHNPSTWPRQARMAASGEWKELKVLQEKLKGGLFEKKKATKKVVKKTVAKKTAKKAVKKSTKPSVKKKVVETTVYE